MSGIDITGRVVTVIVGEAEAPFYVHASVISSHSPFFAAALRNCWKEGLDGVITLPDDKPDVAERYFQFIYTGDVLTEWTRTTTNLQPHENLPEYRTLASLYVFGEKLGDVAFKNAVVDKIIKRLNTAMSDGTTWNPVGDVIDIVYRGTLYGRITSPQLMVDVYRYKGYSPWIVEDPESNNKEFLMELTRNLLDDRFTVLGNPPFRTSDIATTYHEPIQATR